MRSNLTYPLAVVVGLGFALGCARPCPPEPEHLARVNPRSRLTAKMVARPAERRVIAEEAMERVVREARTQAAGVDSDKAPTAYVRAFESALRPRVEALLGSEVQPLVFDERKTAERMYRNLAMMVERRSGRDVFIGDEKKGATRREAVSMFSGSEQCTAIVIAKNAIATAKHCTTAASKKIRIGPSSTVGNLVDIDPAAFVPVKDLHGVDLDMAILVRSSPIGAIQDSDLPVFASTAAIDAATEFRPVGYGGAENDHSDSGLKRMGLVPALDTDCSDPGVAADYKCTPGYEIVAGAFTLLQQASCPPPGDAVKQYGACRGDSGGPVYIESNGRLLLAGMIRRIEDPSGCGCGRATNVYVRFDKQLDAIKKMKNIEFLPDAFAEMP